MSSPSVSSPSGSPCSNILMSGWRRMLGLEGPIRIQFTNEWQHGNPLFDWHHRHSDWVLRRMQLRKECSSPWFHEYIVFELGGPCGIRTKYFRIDRRPAGNVLMSLETLRGKVINAHDIIEEVRSLDDSQHDRSNCSLEIEFKSLSPRPINLAFILKICHAIHQHSSAKMYTIARYNCYFFSQTILRCTAQQTLCVSLGSRKDGGNFERHLLEEGLSLRTLAIVLPKTASDPESVEKEHELDTCANQCAGARSYYQSQAVTCKRFLSIMPVKRENHDCAGVSGTVQRYSTILGDLIGLNSQPEQYFDLASCHEMHTYIEGMVQDHSERILQYGLETDAAEVAKDITGAMSCIWDMVRTCPE